MAGKRKWITYPGRLSQELNGVSGVGGLSGTALGVAGVLTPAGILATSLVTGGIALGIGSLIWALWKGIPPKMKSPQELIGKTLTLEELDQVYPYIRRLAIVGPTQVGKTTLLNRMQNHPKPNERTQSINAKIISLSTSPQTYLAVLDGGGEKYIQQFKICEPADFLCIMIDHNTSHDSPAVSDPRILSNSEFLKQIRESLQRAPQKKWVEILFNKSDLWTESSTTERARFEAFCVEEVQKWKDGNLADYVTSHPHSNKDPEDIARFVNKCSTQLLQLSNVG